MNIGVLALVGVTPEHMAALTAAGYAVREAGDTVRAVLTNGRGGLSGDEMGLLPNLEIVCTGSAGYEAVDLDTARRRGIVFANCPDANARRSSPLHCSSSWCCVTVRSTRNVLINIRQFCRSWSERVAISCCSWLLVAKTPWRP